MTIKEFLNNYSVVVFSTIGALIIFIIALHEKSIKFKYAIDKILLKNIPLLSPLLLTASSHRFFLVLKILVASKYKFQTALENSKIIMDNSYFLKQIQNIINGISNGKDITSAVSNTDLFDQFTVRLLSTGEKSNSVEQVLIELENVYENKLNDKIQQFSSAIEPIMVGLIGGIILFIILAIFLPIWEMGTVLN